MKKIYLLALAVLTFTTTFSQLGNYSAGKRVKIIGQRTSLTITSQKTEIKTEKQAATAVIGSLLAPLVDVFIKGASEKLKQNVAKYQDSFSVASSGQKFWEDATHVNLPILTILRTVIKKDGGQETNAMKITLTPELSSDKTAFRLVASAPFDFTYSSAKTKGDYDYIDISLDIKFKALLVNKSQYESKDLRATNIRIPMVKAGSATLPPGSYTSGWFPFPTVPSLEIESDVTEKGTVTTSSRGTKDGKAVNDDLTTTTTSLKNKAKDIERLTTLSGVYEFEVTVRQTNPYKIKAENMQKITETSGDASSTFLKAIIDAIFKKEDKKDTEETSN